MANYTSTLGVTGSMYGGASTGVTLPEFVQKVWSREIRHQVQPILRYASLVSEKEDLKKRIGEKVQFNRYLSLKGDAALTEGVRVEKKNIDADYIEFTVTEHGLAVEMTERLRLLSYDDLIAVTGRMLGEHAAVYWNTRIYKKIIAAAGASVAYANKKTRTTLTDADVFDTALIKDGVLKLAVNKAPKFSAEAETPAYLVYLHPNQARNLTDDPTWTNSRDYAAPTDILNGEIGRFHDCRFIETTLINLLQADGDIYRDNEDTTENLASAGLYPAAATNGVFQAIMVGDHVFGRCMVQDIHLRDDGVQDFGRLTSVGWFSHWADGVVEEAHICILETGGNG